MTKSEETSPGWRVIAEIRERDILKLQERIRQLEHRLIWLLVIFSLISIVFAITWLYGSETSFNFHLG